MRHSSDGGFQFLPPPSSISISEGGRNILFFVCVCLFLVECRTEWGNRHETFYSHHGRRIDRRSISRVGVVVVVVCSLSFGFLFVHNECVPFRMAAAFFFSIISMRCGVSCVRCSGLLSCAQRTKDVVNNQGRRTSKFFFLFFLFVCCSFFFEGGF